MFFLRIFTTTLTAFFEVDFIQAHLPATQSWGHLCACAGGNRAVGPKNIREHEDDDGKQSKRGRNNNGRCEESH